MDTVQHIFKGTFIHSTTRCDCEVIENHILGVDHAGKILFFEDAQKQSKLAQKWGFDESSIQELGKKKKRTLRNGTTTACYFATIHTDASIVLADAASQYGQRAFIGKVCMDRNDTYQKYSETTEESIRETKRVKAIITPRFAISCSERLLNELGKFAEEQNLHIQSHISESPAEIKEVLRLFPDYKNYTEVYDRNKLLTNKTVMAHGCYLTNEELHVFRERGAAISHCPNSNISLCSGHLDVRNALNQRVKVGFGTDVAGGYSVSLLDAIRKAIETSKILFMERSKWDTNKTENEVKGSMTPKGINRDAQNDKMEKNNVLSYKEAFRLATLGGSEALSIDHIIGNFEVGKEFDALLINPDAKDSPFEVFSHIPKEEMLQKFLILGDDRNIKAVYVAGRCTVPFSSNT
ncbi:hypothetical protein GDO78_006911 [Eleutherodactylus coqui]|uniref:Amidohydrolase-related domain-containing protein n=1 Tax=Eleutherodactylus coqui TaxID=57060 RepID=A0A8J6KBE9_ELECQ|nr:hypothetical protein GDO78_006911 [Eleutherodactylus coqui]